MNIAYFYENFVRFTKKFLPLMVMKLFFSKYFYLKIPWSFQLSQIPTQSKRSDRVFSTKIEDHNYVLWTKYFSQKPGEQRLWTSIFLEILPFATRIGIHRGLFSGDNFICKKFQEIATGGITFNIVTISHRTIVYNSEPY